jgi:hypothetical protein
MRTDKTKALCDQTSAIGGPVYPSNGLHTDIPEQMAMSWARGMASKEACPLWLSVSTLPLTGDRMRPFSVGCSDTSLRTPLSEASCGAPSRRTLKPERRISRL